jgi:hypothetical protein
VKAEPLSIDMGKLAKKVKVLARATNTAKLMDQFQFYLCETAKNYDKGDDYAKLLDSYTILSLGYLSRFGEALEALANNPNDATIQNLIIRISNQMDQLMKKFAAVLLPAPGAKPTFNLSYASNFGLNVASNLAATPATLKMVKAHLDMQEDLAFLGLKSGDIDKLLSFRPSRPKVEAQEKFNSMNLKGLKITSVPGHSEFRYLKRGT